MDIEEEIKEAWMEVNNLSEMPQLIVGEVKYANFDGFRQAYLYLIDRNNHE